MWEYIFDYQQREVLKDNLSMNELCLLFYFSKQIINEDFILEEEPTLFKEFDYYKILQALPILQINSTKQLKRFISKLNNSGYISIHKQYSGVTISLTKKSLSCLSKKQSEEFGVKKYFFLLTWTKMSKLAYENGQKCPSWREYINNIYTKYNLDRNNNINNVNTLVGFNNKSSNIVGNPLKLFFEKYPRFETKQLQLLPSGFKVESLIQAVDKSTYLQNNATLSFLLDHYTSVIADKYIDFEYKSRKEPVVKGFHCRTYTAEQLNALFDDLTEVEI